jgi:hypothetical protein
MPTPIGHANSKKSNYNNLAEDLLPMMIVERSCKNGGGGRSRTADAADMSRVL